MKLPQHTLDHLKEFVAEENGLGISDYGLVLAALAVIAGFLAGHFLLFNTPSKPQMKTPAACPSNNSEPRFHTCFGACGMG